MTKPTTYQTAAGHAVTVGSRRNTSGRTAYTYECNGCDGIRGFTTPEDAADEAKRHAERCVGGA